MCCYARKKTVSRSLLTLVCDSLKNYESDYNYDCGISYADFHCKYPCEKPYSYTDEPTKLDIKGSIILNETHSFIFKKKIESNEV